MGETDRAALKLYRTAADNVKGCRSRRRRSQDTRTTCVFALFALPPQAQERQNEDFVFSATAAVRCRVRRVEGSFRTSGADVFIMKLQTCLLLVAAVWLALPALASADQRGEEDNHPRFQYAVLRDKGTGSRVPPWTCVTVPAPRGSDSHRCSQRDAGGSPLETALNEANSRPRFHYAVLVRNMPAPLAQVPREQAAATTRDPVMAVVCLLLPAVFIVAGQLRPRRTPQCCMRKSAPC